VGHYWSFIRAVGWWWLGAVLVLADAAAFVGLEWRGFPIWAVAGIGFLVVITGAFLAYRDVALERDELLAESTTDGPRFKVEAGMPYYARFGGKQQTLVVPEMYLVNRSDRPIELRFSLQPPDAISELFDSRSGLFAPRGSDFFVNPLHLPAHSSDRGRLGWEAGSADLTEVVVDGVSLLVVEEHSGETVAISLPTQVGGFAYPEDAAV
jgi:hypothetical protein